LPRERDKDRDDNLRQKVDVYHLAENLEHCMQCGKCVGACPVASLSPSYNSRQIVSDVLNGQQERWLKSEEIWRCFLCSGCYTLCPVDINFPNLMMQLRYMAIENKYGLKYVAPFKRFAVTALEDGLTFVPASPKGRDRIRKIRTSIGLSPWPEISEKAKKEYSLLFELTGARAFIDALTEENEKPVCLEYAKGRVTVENRKSDKP
jgi:heterodisulfide reductase subunit C